MFYMLSLAHFVSMSSSVCKESTLVMFAMFTVVNASRDENLPLQIDVEKIPTGSIHKKLTINYDKGRAIIFGKQKKKK